MSGGVDTVTLGWVGCVTGLRATILHIEFLSCNLLGDIRLEGREGDVRTALMDCGDRGCVVKMAGVAGCVVKMAVGWSWLCCKDGRCSWLCCKYGSRMELAVL